SPRRPRRWHRRVARIGLHRQLRRIGGHPRQRAVGGPRRVSDRQRLPDDARGRVSRWPVRALALALVLAACTRPGEDRAQAELDVGHAALADATVRIEGGLAQIRDFTDYRLELWSQAPVL